MEECRRLCGQRLFSLAQVPWKLSVAFQDKPACVECRFNSANVPGLFDPAGAACPDPQRAASRWGASEFNAEPKAGVCTNQACFRAKFKASQTATSSVAAKAAHAASRSPKPKRVAAAREMAREFAPDWLQPARAAARAAESVAAASPIR